MKYRGIFLVSIISVLFSLAPHAFADCTNTGAVGVARQNEMNYGPLPDGRIGQQFVASCSGDISTVVSQMGNNNGTMGIDLELQTDSAGNPSNTVISTSDTVFPVGSGCAPYTNTFPSGATVVSGTRYWLVYRLATDESTSDGYETCGDTGGGITSDEEYLRSDSGGAWSNPNGSPTRQAFTATITGGGGGGGGATGTSTPMTYDEELYLYCIALFFLSFLAWRIMFGKIAPL